MFLACNTHTHEFYYTSIWYSCVCPVCMRFVSLYQQVVFFFLILLLLLLFYLRLFICDYCGVLCCLLVVAFFSSFYLSYYLLINIQTTIFKVFYDFYCICIICVFVYFSSVFLFFRKTFKNIVYTHKTYS